MSDSNPSNPRSAPAAEADVDGSVANCCQEDCSFDLDIELVDHTDDTILTPLFLNSFENDQNTKEFVKFEIEIEDRDVDRLEIEITWGTSGQTVYFESLYALFHSVGKHHWTWDGYSNAGILNTRILKDPHLKLELRGWCCGICKTETIEFDNEPEEVDWVDVVIDRNTNHVEVELRVELDDGGDSGVGDEPPEEIFEAGSPHSSIPAGDPRRQAHVRQRHFIDLESLAKEGLKKYWSRDSSNSLNVSTPNGNYTVTTTPVNTEDKSMDDIDLEYNTNDDWGRSSNPGSTRGIFSLFGQFVPEHTVYNAGWIKYSNGWQYQNLADEDEEFKHTAAHEIGHEILGAYGGEDYSYGHRGSSTVITQETLALTDGGVTYPASGEIDLMKYYNGSRPADFFNRSVASEVDVRSLIYLARVEFDD